MVKPVVSLPTKVATAPVAVMSAVARAPGAVRAVAASPLPPACGRIRGNRQKLLSVVAVVAQDRPARYPLGKLCSTRLLRFTDRRSAT